MPVRTGQTDARYWNLRGAHGGWLAARLLGEMRQLEGPALSPRALTVDYMDRLHPGGFQVELRVAARHRHASFVHATLLQDGRSCVHASAVLATPGAPHERVLEPPPRGLARDHPRVDALEALAAFPAMFDYRFAQGWPRHPTGRGHTHGFIRPRDERHITPEMLAMLADAWFPALWSTGEHVTAATVSMSLVFTSNETSFTLGADDYLQASFTASALAGDYGDETGELWWPDGRLAVKAQQLVRYSTGTHARLGAASREAATA